MSTVYAMDHIVLRSLDIEQSLLFYCDVLGMAPVRVDEWRQGEAPFPSVRVGPDTLIDFVSMAGDAGRADGQHLDHFCLVVDGARFTELRDAIGAAGFPVGEIRKRFGARGDGDSFYLDGPEGVEIEIRRYGHPTAP